MRVRLGVRVGVLLWTVGCGAAGSPARHGTAGSYAQSLDSASAACKRSPAYCANVAGEESVVPLQVRAVQAAAAGKAWAALEEVERKGIEAILVECARWADAEVNRREFGGRHPTPAECCTQVGGTAENPVTRAMRLGSAKHALAVQCAAEKLGTAYPGRFSLEQRYRIHPRTQQLERLSHETELRMLRNGGKELVGSVTPDIVIHTSNPLQPQRVYDFKFPCPESNPPKWRDCPPGNPHKTKHQGETYDKVFGAPAFRVTPKGVF